MIMKKQSVRLSTILSLVAGMLVWSTVSFSAEVTLDFNFPGVEEVEQVTETSTGTTQIRLQETTFESLVIPTIKPKIAQEPEVRVEEAEVEGRKEQREVVVQRPLEVSSAVEAGRLSLFNEGGTQVAFRALLERTWDSGFSLDFNASFEHFSLDDVEVDGNGYLVNIGARQQFFEGVMRVGGFFTWLRSDVDVQTDVLDLDQQVNSFGFGIVTSFQKDFGPLALSGGVIYQFLRDTGDLERSNNIFSYGLALGIPMGRRLVGNLEVFQINNIDREDDPIIIGAGFTFFPSPRWGLTLGWKTIQNVDNFTSHEGTIGASVRF